MGRNQPEFYHTHSRAVTTLFKPFSRRFVAEFPVKYVRLHLSQRISTCLFVRAI